MSQRARKAELNRLDKQTSVERYDLDGGICRVVGCFVMGQVHHILPKRSGGTSHIYTIEEKITLCRLHHSDLHDKGLKLWLKSGQRISLRGFCEE